MAKNPKKARQAMIGADVVTAAGCVARELTLGLSVILEEIDSPVADGRAATTARELAEFMFVMTRPATECDALLIKGRDAFRLAAVEWASGVSMPGAAEIAAKCAATVRRLRDTTSGPGGAEKNAPSAATAGQ